MRKNVKKREKNVKKSEKNNTHFIKFKLPVYNGLPRFQVYNKDGEKIEWINMKHDDKYKILQR